MADITHLFGGAFKPPGPEYVAPPEHQLADAMAKEGLSPPDIVFDGNFHRFPTNNKKRNDLSGWYIAYNSGIGFARFGDFRDGSSIKWVQNMGRELSPVERMEITRRTQESKAKRDTELAKQRDDASSKAEDIWAKATPAAADHPYLMKKKIQPHGARVDGSGRLIVPLFDGLGGPLSSLQFIEADSTKRYLPGGATGNRHWAIGAHQEGKQIYVAEGFATAATIHEVTGHQVYISYSASQLPPCVARIREAHGEAQEIVIVADHDASGVGRNYADQASAKYGARVVMPPIQGDANDYAVNGHDLAGLLNPPNDGWLVEADDMASQPAPISWLIKHWLQRQSLMMVHGPSGSGKTFVVLDMSLHMAAGLTNWHGHRVTPGRVVYLAGEGHHGIRSRIAAWKTHHRDAGRLNMSISRTGCDLNKATGYQLASEAIRSQREKPALIIVDTLHRFLSGDENSAEDAKTMLDACASLMYEFGCSVLLVHHTGVSEETQHRARGSSAWKGALEIEISVIPPQNEDGPIEIVMRKSKDAELADDMFLDKQIVTIPGWIDEDGEAVSSVVLVPGQAQAKKATKEDRHQHDMLIWMRGSWVHGGCELHNNKFPMITPQNVRDYLMEFEGLSETSAYNQCEKSRNKSLIQVLTDAKLIEKNGRGWIVKDPACILAWNALAKTLSP